MGLLWTRLSKGLYAAEHGGVRFTLAQGRGGWRIAPAEAAPKAAPRTLTLAKSYVDGWIDEQARRRREKMPADEVDLFSLEELVQRLRYDGVLGIVERWIAAQRENARVSPLAGAMRETMTSLVLLARLGTPNQAIYAAHREKLSLALPGDVLLALVHCRIWVARHA